MVVSAFVLMRSHFPINESVHFIEKSIFLSFLLGVATIIPQQHQQFQQAAVQQQQQSSLTGIANITSTNTINPQTIVGNIPASNVRNANLPVLVSLSIKILTKRKQDEKNLTIKKKPQTKRDDFESSWKRGLQMRNIRLV